MNINVLFKKAEEFFSLNKSIQDTKIKKREKLESLLKKKISSLKKKIKNKEKKEKKTLKKQLLILKKFLKKIKNE